MGHYRSEMMCNKCGDVRCSCPVVEVDEPEMWVVDTSYNIMTVKEFQQQRDAKFIFYYSLKMQKFATREEAKAHAAKKIDEEITAAINRIQDLNIILINLS